MSLKQTIVLAVALLISYAAGVVTGQTEKFELEGNMKLFGAGNGIIFTDGTKQTSAGVGSSTDVMCAVPCVGLGEIAANAVGSAEVAADSLTAADLALDSVTASEIAAGAVGTSEVASDSLTANDLGTNSVGTDEIAASAVGSGEVLDNNLTSDDLAPNSVAASEIADNAVGSTEVNNNSLTSDDLAADSVAASEIATDAVGATEIQAAAVGASEVADGSIRLTELNGNVVMNYTLDLFGVINNGSCSSFSGQGGLTNIAANSFVIIFGVRPVGSNVNPGWVIEGEDNPTQIANQIDVRVCNNTGANADPPNLRFNIFAIAP